MSTKNIGIWLRVSTEMQVKDESPEIHEKRARMYAESRGWNVVTIYRLDALSGKSVLDYPETIRMLTDIQKGHISGLIFSKLARLARNTKELLELSQYFKEHNADLISLSEAIDTSSPAGRLFFTIIAAMAQWEREEIADRIKASVPIRAKMGKHLGGAAPFGYKWVNKALEINETEAPIRKLIYEIFLNTKRLSTTAQILNERGHRMRKGRLFSQNTIERLLLDTTAKGEHRCNYTTHDKDERVILKPESEWVINKVPSIIEATLWEECNSYVHKIKTKRSPRGPRPVHLFAGIIECSCSKKMYVFYNSNPTYQCKKCKKKIPIADLEEIYHEQLKSFLLTDQDITEVETKVQEEIMQKETLLKKQKGKFETLSEKVKEIVDLKIENKINLDDLKRLYEPVNIRLRQIEKDIPELEAEIQFLRLEKENSKVKHTEAKDLYTNWPSLPTEQKRQIIELITEKIILHDDSINIVMSFRPAPHHPFLKAGKSKSNL